ncbi:SDR family NAD(P)-dependent oxidoreductase [Actinomycetota bacterium]
MKVNYKRFKDKVAIVTGGSAGIGQSTVEEFLLEGAKVVYTGISDRGFKSLKHWEDTGYEVVFLRGDMAEEDFCKKIVKETLKKFDRIDYLINNAADFNASGINATRKDWERVLAVNIIGYATMANLVAKSMIKNGNSGAIVNISSVSAYVGQANRHTYCTTKAGILEMTRCQAKDLAKFDIRVNSISPGYIWTAVSADYDREKWDPILGKYHIMARCGEAKEVARPILFLCSDDASFITGIDLPVDGGYLAMGSERMRDILGDSK